MRIALVTEQFAPSTEPAAHVTREVLSRLIEQRARRHGLRDRPAARRTSAVPASSGPSRMTPVSAIRRGADSLPPRRLPTSIDPHRLGIKVRRGGRPARRTGPCVVLDPRRWTPWRSTSRTTTPACATAELHDRWARRNPLDGNRLRRRLRRSPRPDQGDQPARGHGAAARCATRWWSATAAAQRCCEPPAPRCCRTSPVSSVPAASPSFDVLLQPGNKEIYGTTGDEALASGVPVIVYDGGMASDVVRDEHNGLLVDTRRGVKTFAGTVAGARREPGSSPSALTGLARGSVEPTGPLRGRTCCSTSTTRARWADPPPIGSAPGIAAPAGHRSSDSSLGS